MAVEHTILPDAGAMGTTLSDAELIAATRAGDAAAFAVLYERHVGAARACARHLVRSRSDADDLVAEGFAKVLGALRRGKGPDLAFRPYLLTSVRNALYDRTRRDKKIEFTDEPPEPVNAVLLGAAYDREDQAMVAQAYAALPERWQMVLWHADVEGRPPAEIAPLLGISANSVAALAYRAREGLRQAYLQAHINRGVGPDCKGTTEKLSAFVRDGLSARDRRAVEEHLEGCASCRALLAELQDANRSLKIVLIPMLAGIPVAAYLSGLGGGGIVALLRKHPAPMAAGAVAAAAAIVMAGVAFRGPGDDGGADALAIPPVGSGRPTTTTTSTTVPLTSPVTVAATVATVATTVPFVAPVFDTGVPPNTAVPFNPNATTATTVRRTATTTRPATTTTRPATTTTTSPPAPEPAVVATTTTTTTTTTVPPSTEAPPLPPAVTAGVESVGPVYSGQSAYFRMRVSNAASGNAGSARHVAVGPAEGVVVTFTVPAGATFLPESVPTWQCEVTGSSVRCLLPRLEPGATTESLLRFDVAVDAAGTFTLSPVVTVNGSRVDAPPVTQPVADGSEIADFLVAPGAELVAVGGSTLSCDVAAGVQGCDAEGAPRTPAPSNATLALDGRAVIAAYLVWQGQGDPATQVTLTRPDGVAVPVAPALRRSEAEYYVAAADVTAQITADGVYAVSGVPSGTGGNAVGGWELAVVVAGADPALRAFTLALPIEPIQNTQSVPVVAIDGLSPLAADRAVTLSVLVAEGEESLKDGEALTLNGVELTSATHPGQGNAFASKLLGQSAYGAGTDFDVYATTVPATDRSIQVAARTGQDKVWISAVGILCDL